MRKNDFERNKLIYNLYFDEKLTLSSISHQINLSVSQISRILSNSPRYMQEKNIRKEKNKKKHREQAKEIMRNKRNKNQYEEKQIMEMLHNQASYELSYDLSFIHPMSNTVIRKNCSSAYKNNVSKERFELKDDMTYSTDMPKIIKY